MKRNQANAGQKRRLMYVENKDGKIDGAAARIGWVGFSKSGLSIHYRGRTLSRSKGAGSRGNYFDMETGEGVLGFRRQTARLECALGRVGAGDRR